MAKEKVYKTPVKASQLIKTLREKNLRAEVIDDEDCFPTVGRVSLGCLPGESCWVTYSIQYKEDSPTRGLSAGYYRLNCLGVIYKGNRCFYSSNDLKEEDLSGRAIKYDINPDTGETYTRDDVLKVIHETVSFNFYSEWDYQAPLWNAEDLDWLRVLLLEDDEYNYGYEDEDECYFAVNKKGKVYFFDKEYPHPKGKGFRRISKEEAIDIIIEKRQEFGKE